MTAQCTNYSFGGKGVIAGCGRKKEKRKKRKLTEVSVDNPASSENILASSSDLIMRLSKLSNERNEERKKKPKEVCFLL